MYKYKLKILVFFFLGMLAFNTVDAQGINVDWGPKYKRPGGTFGDFKFLGIYGDYYYLVVQTRRENILLQYGMDHKLVDKTELKFRHNNYRLEIKDIVTTKEGPFIYMHYYSDQHREWSVYASKFEDGFFSNPKEIFYESFDDLPRARISRAYDRFTLLPVTQKDLVLSQDSNFVAFVNVIPSQDYRQDDVISVAVWDSKMKLAWQAYFDFKFGDRDYDIKDAVVSNSGEVYFLASVDKRYDLRGKPISIKEKNLPNYVYNIYKVTEDEIIENDIDIGRGNAIVDAGLFIEDETTDEILLGGFYTTNDHKTRLKGVFFTSGTKNLEMGDAKIHEFNRRFLEGLASSRAINKNKGLPYNFDIKNLLRFDDGTMGFIAENSYVTTSTTPSSIGYGGINGGLGNNTLTYTFHTNDIIIPRFDSSGELINIEKIDKSFRSENVTHTSYSLATVDNKTYLIFNDRKSRSETKKIKKKGRRFTDMAVIGPNGAIEYHETIFSNKEIDLPFVPSLSDFSEDYMIIGGALGTKFTFGKIDLK